jgi:hypothetical protein
MPLTWYRHFQRNGGLNQILRRLTPRFHYGSKVPAITITVFITILEQNRWKSSQRSAKFSEEGGTSIVNHLQQQPRVTWSILTTKVNVKNTFTSHIDKIYFWHFCWLPYLYTFSLHENPSFIIVSAETEYISTKYWYRNINFIRDRIRRISL